MLHIDEELVKRAWKERKSQLGDYEEWDPEYTRLSGEMSLLESLFGVNVFPNTKYKVTISVKEEVRGEEDSNPGEYTLEFETLDDALKAAKNARETLDGCSGKKF